MIKKILDGAYEGIQLLHVPMRFSKDMDEVGKTGFFKIIQLFVVISKIYWFRIFKRGLISYYPPAGPNRIPIIRDIIILISTRWLFRETIFHFHAGGVSEIAIQSPMFKYFFRCAYHKADCAILLSELNPADGKNLQAKKEVIIPYGIEDNYSEAFQKPNSPKATILFVGVIMESKGILVLLESCRLLISRGIDFKLEVMGKFVSPDFQREINDLVLRSGLENHVTFLGVLSGSLKFDAYRRVDIFCFPTFFESETFGVVLLEAMQFCLPVVATRWRGVPSIIEDGVNGFLVNPSDAEGLTDKLELLIMNTPLRNRMGQSGRDKFLRQYTLSEFQNKMGQVFRAA